jgi:hypothetical protein
VNWSSSSPIFWWNHRVACLTKTVLHWWGVPVSFAFFLKPLLWGKPPQPPNFFIKEWKVFIEKLQAIYKEKIKQPMEGFKSMITTFELCPSSPYA